MNVNGLMAIAQIGGEIREETAEQTYFIIWLFKSTMAGSKTTTASGLPIPSSLAAQLNKVSGGAVIAMYLLV